MAEQHYSGLLSDAFESTVGPSLVSEHPEWSEALYASVLMPRVEKLEMDVSAVAVPRLSGKGKVIHGFEWDQLDALSPAELAAELLTRVRDSLQKNE